ncbi:MAG: ATP-dependent RNA helicase DbpA [Gammaproteobacteria bacterium]|jgi:ATP-dependent RNA helicase DbpA|nr:ATP-dependent RNA helicase DbpA [Gammaproteobacteria bacterium]
MDNSDFSTLPLSPSMLHNLAELGYPTMTAVQSAALPHILEGEDLLVQAKTGSGKTATFGIGLLERLRVEQVALQALILCPTRELADQVAKALRQLARMTANTKILTLSGGVPFHPQQKSLQHPPHIVVGTPGRILKHLNKKSLSLQTLTTLVLDEADRMLDMGFFEEINAIIQAAPSRRQTLLFSATYPQQILTLSRTIQRDAISVQTGSSEPANPIQELFYESAPDQKISTLIRLLAHYRPDNVVIFSNTKQQTREISGQLNRQGVEALALHGDLDQRQRNDVWTQFANNSCLVLVATDVAARGLDIKGLGMVVNYGLPADETTYIHRIGRTGRAGEEGLAVTLIAGQESLKAERYQSESRSFRLASQLPAADAVTLTPDYRTLLIGGGKRDKMRPGDILGALTRGAGLSGSEIGQIDIHDHQSYVAVQRKRAEQACARLGAGKIKGRKFTVRLLGKSARS